MLSPCVLFVDFEIYIILSYTKTIFRGFAKQKKPKTQPWFEVPECKRTHKYQQKHFLFNEICLVPGTFGYEFFKKSKKYVWVLEKNNIGLR